MFKKVATLQFKKIYASDVNGNYYWRDFVKQANDKLATDANFVPKSFYEYDTKNFLYITARAISGMEKWGPNGNYDAFPWEELKRSYPTFCGKGFYIEHKEDDEKDAKGIILDAQPDDDNEFINCICAISKEEYPEICDDILNGKLNQVSMSCLAAECECSECHNVATKEEELCEHMNPEHPHFCKGSSNLQNKPIYEINRNIVFTGLSGVAVPADKDAFIFDVKASKKSKTSIDKEYNKYLRAKKEYEYINKILQNKDLCKYIISKLETEQKIQKKANIQAKDYKELLDNIQKAGYKIDEHYYDQEYDDIKAFKDGKEYILGVWVEDYEGPDSYSIINIKETGKTYKDFGEFLVNSKLNKKASYTDKEISNIGYEQGVKDGTRAKGIKETKEIIDENLNQLKEKYSKDKNRMGSFILKEWNSFVAGYTNGFSSGLTGNIEKKAKRVEDIEEENKVLTNLGNAVDKTLNYYYDAVKTAGNPEDEAYYKNVIRFLMLIIPTIDNNEFYKLSNFEVEAKLKKKADVEYFSDKVQEIPEIDFYTEFMNAGKSKGCNSDINKDQLELGIKVEMEHTTNPVIAEKIACDHIKEIPNYYTLLAEMEASAKASFEEAKHVVNKETNEEFPTKLASKQFFKVRKAAGSGFANIIKFKTDKDFYDKIKQLRKNKNIEVIYKIIDGVGLYLLYKGNEHLGTLNTHELTYAFDTDISKQASKQFFKVNKSSKKWFKVANIYDDPEERNNIDNYGLSELQRKELQNVIDHIDIVNEDVVVTWDELVESVNQDILDYDFMNKNKVNIIDYIENELGQEIEVY